MADEMVDQYIAEQDQANIGEPSGISPSKRGEF
jgi:hypothetical protein